MTRMIGKMKSIKRDILFELFLITIIIFTMLELFLLRRIHYDLVSYQDHELGELQVRADNLTSMLFQGVDGKIQFTLADELAQEYDSSDHSAYFVLIHGTGTIEIARSQSLGNNRINVPASAYTLPADSPITWVDTVDLIKVRFLAIMKDIQLEDGKNEMTAGVGDGPQRQIQINKQCLVVVGEEQAESEESFGSFLRLTSISLASGLFLLLVTSWLAVSRSLHPLEKLEKEVQAIHSSNLRPVTVPNRQEIASVALTLNAVLHKLKESFDCERRLTANITHELRTPITEILTLSEVALKGKTEAHDEDRRNFEDILASALQMQHIVTKLLTMAHGEEGVLKPHLEKIMLGAVVDDIWNKYSQKAEGKKITYNRTIDSYDAITTDGDILRSIIDNLLSNAVDYTPAGGSISIEFQQDDHMCTMTFTNTVHDFTPEDVSHLFERFWRKDEVRTPGGEHIGLGLSLVQALSRTLGFTVHSFLSKPDSLTITLTKSFQ